MAESARSKLDIIYDDILGDVSQLLDRVEKLQAGIPRTTDGAEAALRAQAAALVAAAQKMQGIFVSELIAASKHLDEQAIRAAERSLIDLRKRCDEVAREAARAALGDKALYADAIETLQKASQSMGEEAARIKKSAREIEGAAQENAALNTNLLIALMCGTGIISGSVCGGIVAWLLG